MSTDHRARFAEILKELVATFVQQEANTDPLITVTNVDVSPDQRRAIIFITTIPEGQEKEKNALIFLKRTASALREHIKQHGRLKRIPHLDFMIDAGERHRQHMDEILREIADRKKAL